MIKETDPNKLYTMHIETRGKDLTTLLNLYNQEIDTLKSKLLNGIPWEELSHTRKNITELALAIHRSHSTRKEDLVPPNADA